MDGDVKVMVVRVSRKFSNITFYVFCLVAIANITPSDFHILVTSLPSAHPNQSQLLPRGVTTDHRYQFAYFWGGPWPPNARITPSPMALSALQCFCLQLTLHIIVVGAP